MEHLSDQEILSWAERISGKTFQECDTSKIRDHLNRCLICLKRVFAEADAIDRESIYRFPPGRYRSRNRRSNRDCKSKTLEDAESQALIEFLKGNATGTPVFIDLEGVVANKEFIRNLVVTTCREFSSSPCGRCIHDYWIVLRNVEKNTKYNLNQALNEELCSLLIEVDSGPEVEIIGDLLGQFIEGLYYYVEDYPRVILDEKRLMTLLELEFSATPELNVRAAERILSGSTMFIQRVPGKIESDLPRDEPPDPILAMQRAKFLQNLDFTGPESFPTSFNFRLAIPRDVFPIEFRSASSRSTNLQLLRRHDYQPTEGPSGMPD